MVPREHGGAGMELGVGVPAEDDNITIRPLEVLDELMCDWPLVSSQEAAALSAVLPPATVCFL